MVRITYKEIPEKGLLSLLAEGHAGYAPKGQDIVCAAVSTLMQSLAYSVDNDGYGGAIEFDGGKDGPVFSVQARMCPENRAKFELVLDGLYLLQQNYPAYVTVVNLCANDVDVMDLQIFADGGGDGAAGGEAGGEGEAAAPVEMPKLRPAEERLARRSGVLKRTAAKEAPAGKPAQPEQNAETAPEEKAVEDTGSAADGEGSENGGKQQRTPEERKKAFGELMQGEYREEAEAMMKQAMELAARNLQASPALQGLLEALRDKYGTDADSLEALTEAVKNGVVKDDAYYEKLAVEKGVAVKTARELDKLESQNRRLTAQQQAVQQMERQRIQQAKILQLQEGWNREEAALKQKYPDFEQYRGEFLENPETKQMLMNGVPGGARSSHCKN